MEVWTKLLGEPQQATQHAAGLVPGTGVEWRSPLLGSLAGWDEGWSRAGDGGSGWCGLRARVGDWTARRRR